MVLADQRDAVHDSRNILIVEGFYRMHRAAIIPHENVIIRPYVCIDIIRLGCVGDEFVEKSASSFLRHTFDTNHGVG